MEMYFVLEVPESNQYSRVEFDYATVHSVKGGSLRAAEAHYHELKPRDFSVSDKHFEP